MTRVRSVTEPPTIDGMTSAHPTILDPTAATARKIILLISGAAVATGILVASPVLLRLSSRASTDDAAPSPPPQDTKVFLSIFSDE